MSSTLSSLRRAVVRNAAVRRALYAGGSLLRSLHLYSVSFEEDELLAITERRTGLSDFGGSDFLPGLRVLTRALREEAGLPFQAELAERFWLIHLLERRLHIQRHITEHPEILRERIDRPVFVLAMPRSGTTLLQNLLDSDPGARWLRHWELREPWPRVADGARDPRRLAFENRVARAREEGGTLDKLHAIDSPADCDMLFLPAFLTPLHAVSKNVPTYERWQNERPREDWVTAYEYYRLQLQRLQWAEPPGSHWVLKSPLHLAHIPELLEVFPDARLIHLHRDPKKSVASACSMASVHRAETYPDVDPREIGRFFSGRLVERVERGLAARAALPPGRVYDVHYPDLLRDPRGTVRGIYEHFDMEMDPAMGPRMQAHLEANPQHKRGVHKYSLESFGLSAEEIDRRFAKYRATCGVETEGARA